METTARLNARIVHNGGWIATVAFLWRPQRVIAEYYGDVHQQSWRGDLARTAQLDDAGYPVIVITHRDLGVADADLYHRLVRYLRS